MRVRAEPSIAVQPSWAMAGGALGVSTSAIFIDLAGTSPATTTFFRCALAVPLLLPLTVWERRRQGAPTRRQVAYALAAGAFFAGDALWWTQAIGEVGAGLSTVLVNAQVVLVPLLALVLDREPISRRFLASLPVMVSLRLTTPLACWSKMESSKTNVLQPSGTRSASAFTANRPPRR